MASLCALTALCPTVSLRAGITSKSMVEHLPERQALRSIIEGIFDSGGGETSTSSASTGSNSSSSSSGNSGGGDSTSTSSITSTSTITLASRSSSITTQTSATSAPSTPSISLFTSSVTSNGQVVPVTLTQTVVVVNSSESPSLSSSKSASTNAALIGGVVGGVVGGLALLALLIAAGIIMKHRKDRMGSANFLCCGTLPKYDKRRDLQHSARGAWPTFYPSSNSRSQRDAHMRGGPALPQATLPDVFPEEGVAEQLGTVGYDHSEGIHNSASGVSFSHQTSESPRAEVVHSLGHASSSVAACSPVWTPAQMYFAPDYSHLDPPEMREARAREVTAAAAVSAPSSPPSSATQSSAPQLIQPRGYLQAQGRPQSADSTIAFAEGSVNKGGVSAADGTDTPSDGSATSQPLHLTNS
ncbi:hypothetical protein K437DRAFT_274066 [Tilletiaria anomala UBC 951]|uniref:Mid2 domain-containing protein n=1 Tax=Tilletiaria anomala (strain ATCC 24038 / CBS 436.72 / UBC 951) TaxID=1037660 RepID=A0A066VWW1_TILAU|nr:uncharacterized protein K437DRAFT_274066 [Tilletiaria anomala UBC 951]KDN45961.1 hypothetical protein K437DRAFT_274066 [Tilletiaria anomala UBC 951]